MINPHLLYCLGFIIASGLYLLGWSDAYSSLTLPLTLFICVTLLIHFGLSQLWVRTKVAEFYKTTPDLNPVRITLFIYSLWIADFFYEGGIPLIKILTNQPYDYRLFGVPSLHVLAVTFGSFYIIYLFHVYLSERKTLILVLYLVNSGAAILIYSRSMLFFNLAGSLFIYLFSLKNISSVRLAILSLLGVLLFFFFGVIGNKRIAFEAGTPYNTETFLEIGKASKSFRESYVPNEFFWSYMYISSPLANLQANIKYWNVPPINVKRFLEYINNELLFESISKRINAVVGIEREKEMVIKDPFNVSTIYSRSYCYLGWWGMLFMGVFILVLPWGYLKLLKTNNPYRLTGIAILCTVYLFTVYDNTIRLMALGFQLVYPIAFPMIERLLKIRTNE